MAAAPAASARKTRLPNVTNVTPAAAAVWTSRGSQPPSGPISTIASGGPLPFEGSLNPSLRLFGAIRLDEHESHTARGASVTTCVEVLDLQQRRHNSTTTLLHRRDDRSVPALAATGRLQRRPRYVGSLGRRMAGSRTTPSMTASRITRSILSLFKSDCASVIATAGSGAGWRALEHAHGDACAIRSTPRARSPRVLCRRTPQSCRRPPAEARARDGAPRLHASSNVPVNREVRRVEAMHP